MENDMTKKSDAFEAMEYAIKSVLPYDAVKTALSTTCFSFGRIIPVAIGKAAYSMAKAAKDALGDRLSEGIVLTKYGHLGAPIDGFRLCEGGHPVVDEGSLIATEAILDLTQDLTQNDTVLLLLSGGGSSLLEKPLIPLEELRSIHSQLLTSGASIQQINLIRKRLSAVKGGRFALHCAPAEVVTLILSDVLGDDPKAIASGPTVADHSTISDVEAVITKTGLQLSEPVLSLLKTDLPNKVSNSQFAIIGNLHELCIHAYLKLSALGYRSIVVTETLSIDAEEAANMIVSHAITHADTTVPLAFLYGGETVVHVTGNGKGGRNQHLALAAAIALDGISNISVLSFGSDGTDGPTDAAGGYVTGESVSLIRKKGADAKRLLENHDSYTALSLCDGLVITGPTGTNVNDLTIVLIHPHSASRQ